MLDGHERRRSLHHFAQCHRVREELRGAQDDRHHRRKDEVPIGDHGRAQILPAQLAPAHDHAAESFAERAFLLGLAAQERDAFAVLAQAGRGIAELGLGLVLALRDLDEAAADEEHRRRREERIDDGDED